MSPRSWRTHPPRPLLLGFGGALLVGAPSACSTKVEFFTEDAVLGAGGSVEGSPTGGSSTSNDFGHAGAFANSGGSGAGQVEPQPEPVVFELNTDAPCPDDISFTEDLLEVVFDSRELTMTTSQRNNLLSPWSLGAPVPGLAAPGDDTGAEISRDGLSLWWSSRRPDGMNHFDLWFATRPTRTADWGAATPIDELNTLAMDAFPTVSADRLYLVFLGVGPGTDLDLYSSTRDSPTAPWGPRVLLNTVNSPFGEGMPHLSADGLKLYFGSDRPGGAGANDLYVAERRTRASDFSSPKPLVEYNTEENEGDPWISSDGRFFVFSRNNGEAQCTLFAVSQ